MADLRNLRNFLRCLGADDDSESVGITVGGSRPLGAGFADQFSYGNADAVGGEESDKIFFRTSDVLVACIVVDGWH